MAQNDLASREIKPTESFTQAWKHVFALLEVACGLYGGKKIVRKSITEFNATQETHIATSDTGEATVPSQLRGIYMYIYRFAHP